MTNKIINIIIFAVAGITCLLALVFAMGFDDNREDLFYEIGTIKSANSQLLSDFDAVTLDQLPEFVEKNNAEITQLNTSLKEEQLQKDILYTFIVQLKDLDENTFDAYKANFNASSAILFAKSTNGDKYKTVFEKVNTYGDLQKAILALEAEYEVIKQDYLVHKNYKTSLEKFNARSRTVTEVVSDAKKTVDFETLKSDVKSCENEDKTINLAVIFVYIILIAAIAVTVFFALLQLFQNFSSSYKALLAVLALVVVFVISYFASSGELSASAIKEGLTGNQVKIIGAGVITCYFVFFGAIASIFISWLINKLKKS